MDDKIDGFFRGRFSLGDRELLVDVSLIAMAFVEREV
jgi:hypothetical protein